MTTYTQNPDNSYSATDTEAFDPAALVAQITAAQAQIADLQSQQGAAADLASRAAAAGFQPQIDAANATLASLQAILAAFQAAFPSWTSPA